MTASRPGLAERAQRAEQKGNREIRDLWERYRSHRERVTAEILALAPAGGGGRLCLLGAGNANDLDLEALAGRWGEIHLVDIDPAALARATGRQPPEVRAKLRGHAPVDLSGLFHQMERAGPQRELTTNDVLVAAGTVEVLERLPAGFDGVASCCVLSQMSWALETLEKPEPALLASLQQALLRIHLRTLLGLLQPAGTAVLIADLVSSEGYPLDDLPPDTDLRALADKLAADRLTHTVCNPELVRQVLRRDPVLAAVCQPLGLGTPWLWSGPNDLTYLVRPLALRPRA